MFVHETNSSPGRNTGERRWWRSRRQDNKVFSPWYQCLVNILIRCSIAQAANGLELLGVVTEIHDHICICFGIPRKEIEHWKVTDTNTLMSKSFL
jgi:hypothetical protein